MSSKYEIMELIRRKVSMAADIVEHVDSDYSNYAGASLETAQKIAVIDTMIENRLIPDNALLLVKLYRSYLDKQRKAFFASIGSTEITKLGFIQGNPRSVIRSRKTNNV